VWVGQDVTVDPLALRAGHPLVALLAFPPLDGTSSGFLCDVLTV
jgi:hypothetical protein